MLAKCGHKCFLGPGESFPICKRNTCTRDRRGVIAAKSRSAQFGHWHVRSKAERLVPSKKRTYRKRKTSSRKKTNKRA
jgi:hypothetical protein